MTVFDLHTHSTASDGSLRPATLVARAHERGVQVLALTDHDTVDGIAEAQTEARRLGVTLVPGVECSALWQGQSIHVVGLGVNPDCARFRARLAGVRQQRDERARAMAKRLEKRGIPGVYAGARALAGDAPVTRNHLGRYLVEQGHGRGMNDVFRRYLRRGRPGYAPPAWPEVAVVVDWIRAAGGQAVLAHPLAYQMTGTKLGHLLDAFKTAGGSGLEVVCGRGERDSVATLGRYALSKELAGSVGSDFHTPDTAAWLDLGYLPPLPAAVTPVWREWVLDGVTQQPDSLH